MGSNRTIQTILQAVLVVLLAALVFKVPAAPGPAAGKGGSPAHAQPMPSEREITNRFRAYFTDDKEASTKAQLLSVGVKDMSVEGSVAHVKLRIVLKWEGHNIGYTDGPLKNAPGKRGDTYEYVEIFKFRRWSKGWDVEGRRDPPIIQ
jgi:hypothetical protein